MPVTANTLAQVRDLRTTVGQEADAATRDIGTAWTDGWEQLAPLYAAALAGVAAQAVAVGAWLPPWAIARDDGLRRAAQRAQSILADLTVTTGKSTRTAAGNAIAATVLAEPAIMASQLPVAERKAATARFAQAIGVGATAQLASATVSDATAGSVAAATAAVNAINRRLARSQPVTNTTPTALAARLLATVDTGFRAGLTSAVTLARTETLDAYRTAARRVHAANALVVAGWYWQSSLDPATCVSCWSLHGRFFPLSTAGPHDHRQGRCARVVKLRPWTRLGLPGREPPDRIRDAQAAFRRLPEADQLRVMGPTRLDLFRAGHINWGDLAVLRDDRNWRASFLPRTVADLQSIARARANTAA